MKSSSGSESRREVRPLDITLDLSPRTESYSYSNRRQTNGKLQFVYPWMLFVSTAIAGVFCYAYITKPVIVSYGDDSGATKPKTNQPKGALVSNEKPNPKKDPNPNTVSKPSLPPAPASSGFEETNIRMQHILDAESPTGDISRIVVDVPVLYQSRNLLWTQQDAAQARVLLKRLEDYQEKSRLLRDEGKDILEDWNKLMDASVPNQVLRADSPSISSNLSKPSQTTSNNPSEGVKLQSDKDTP